MTTSIRVKVLSYNKDINSCQAVTSCGDKISFDPFVFCAIRMTDEEYEEDYGYTIVGNTYDLYKYQVDVDQVYPLEGGMMLVKDGNA